MEEFALILKISGIMAALFVLALPIWLLGLPGVDGEYARGWKMGLTVIFCYPIAWLLTYAPYFVMRNRLDAQSLLQWQTVTGWIAVVIALLAIVRLIWAFKVMR